MNETGDALIKALTEFGTQIRLAGHQAALALWDCAQRIYGALSQFSRWLGHMVSKIYLSMAEFLADLIFAARVFYPPILLLVVFFVFHTWSAFFLAAGYLLLFAVALFFFYKRPDKSAKIERPEWATYAGHIALVIFSLMSGVKTILLIWTLLTASRPT